MANVHEVIAVMNEAAASAEEIARLRKELSLKECALRECHKEIFKLRDTLLTYANLNAERR